LSVLSGATVRMPILIAIFGYAGWIGVFGPKLILGALILLVRSLFDRTLDRWFAVGFVVMTLIHVSSFLFAVSDTWTVWVKAIL
jgi:hypothetical protein